MLGGYSNHDDYETMNCVHALRECNTIPILSCGMHAGLIEPITNRIGNDYLANAGGAVHGHKFGTKSGAMEIREEIERISK